MKHVEPVLLSELIKQMIAHSPYKHKLEEAAIVCAWNQVMPRIIIQRTEQVLVKNNKIFLKINSAPLRQEIQNAKDQVLMLLKQAVPNYTIADILWL